MIILTVEKFCQKRYQTHELNYRKKITLGPTKNIP